MEQRKAQLLAALDAYSENSSVSNTDKLLKLLIENIHLKELLNLWKDKLTKEMLINNIDILIDIAMEEFEAEKGFRTAFKINDNGNWLRFYIQSEASKQKNYLKNIWLSQISYVNTDITQEDFLEANFLKRDRIIHHLLTNQKKGFYVYGHSGLGKTFLLQFLIVQRAHQGHSAAFINTADLQNFLSKNITETAQIVKLLKSVDVLAFDDLGSERKNEWFRDSILLDVLQYRSQLKKETHFSSNFSLKQLVMVLGEEGSFIQWKRASRLIERIKELSINWFLEGDNLRDSKLIKKDFAKTKK